MLNPFRALLLAAFLVPSTLLAQTSTSGRDSAHGLE